ncbi:hypothetical protein BX666DRAFT_602471 [Dichotomocladium elegans]|nr:hypothetical protein BX666DRAFT_602471 [Dichotomocladium elegans]
MLEGSYQGFIYQPTGPETPTGTSPHLGPSSSPAPQPTSAAYSANNKPDHRHPQHYYRDSYDSAASSNSTNSSNSIGGYYLTQPPAQHYQLPMPASAGNAYEPKSPMFPGRKSDHSDGMILSYPPPPHPQPHHRHQHHDNSSSWSIRPDVGGNSNSNDGGGYSWNYSPPVRPLTLSSPTHAVRGGKSYSSNTETRAGLGGYGDDDTLSPIPKPLVLDQAPGFPPRHKLTTTVWEDEGTVCYQVDAKGICVARRADNHMVNGTKLLNVVGMSRGKRDGILKNERGRIVIKVGAMHLKGVWIALHRAKYLANKFHVCDALYPLFEDNPRKFVHPPSPVISRTLVGRSSNDKQTFWSDTNNGNGPNKRAPLPSIIDQQQGASRGPDPHQHPHTHPLGSFFGHGLFFLEKKKASC